MKFAGTIHFVLFRGREGWRGGGGGSWEDFSEKKEIISAFQRKKAAKP
jgi:hypothetical protein